MFGNFKFYFGLKVFEWRSVDPGRSSIVWEEGHPTKKDSSTYHSSWIQRTLSNGNFRIWVLQPDVLDGHLRIRKAKSIGSPGLDSYPKHMAEFCLKYCLDLVKLNFANLISHNFCLNLVHNGKYKVFGRLFLQENISVWHVTVAICART